MLLILEVAKQSIENFPFLPLAETYSVAFKLSTDNKIVIKLALQKMVQLAISFMTCRFFHSLNNSSLHNQVHGASAFVLLNC